MPPFIQKGCTGSVCIIVKWVKLWKKFHQIVHADVLGLRPVYHRTSPLHRGVQPSFFCLWFWWGVYRCARQYQDISGSCAGGTQPVLIFCLVWQPSRSIHITWRFLSPWEEFAHNRSFRQSSRSLRLYSRGCEGRCPSSVCERAAQEDDGSLDATGMIFIDVYNRLIWIDSFWCCGGGGMTCHVSTLCGGTRHAGGLPTSKAANEDEICRCLEGLFLAPFFFSFVGMFEQPESSSRFWLWAKTHSTCGCSKHSVGIRRHVPWREQLQDVGDWGSSSCMWQAQMMAWERSLRVHNGFLIFGKAYYSVV